MKPLTATLIRESFVNLGVNDRDRVPMPGLHEVIWDDREYLGWRDQRARQRGYLVHFNGEKAVGVVLRASETSLRSGISAMCALCRITQPADQVTLFSATRAGEAGYNGSTVGTYICDDLGCSHIIRLVPPQLPNQPTAEELIRLRSAGLLERVAAFTSEVLRDA